MASFPRLTGVDVVVVLLSLSGRSQPTEYFTDTPPLDYYTRVPLDDCPSRFYPDPYKFSINHTQNGNREFVGEFTHMAAVGWTSKGKTEYLCAGTLISSKYVLTAAHCKLNADGKQPDTVRLGDPNLIGAAEDASIQLVSIRNFKRHPEYLSSRKYFDIALIELETEAKFDAATCPACLWLEKDVPPEKLHAIGFGETIYSQNASPTLQKITLTYMDKQTCTEELPVSTRAQPYGFVNEQFCAESDHMDTCEGDSGGPIQVERVDIDGSVIPLVVGIISFGSPCSVDSIGVYTRVASYRDWIEKEIQQSIDYLTCTRTSSCYSRKRKRSKIEYGSALRPHYRVGLLWDATEHNAFECGATLIDYRFVLTSASCILHRTDKPISIIVETTKETVAIEDVIVHPQFSTNKSQNDIALLKLAKFVKHDADVVPVCLKKNIDQSTDPTIQSISAYGTKYPSKEAFQMDNFERYTITTVTSADHRVECENPQYRENNLYCANASINLIPHVCNLDFGGPVTRKGIFGYVPYLYGIVSKLSEGCDKNVVITKVEDHIQWIESVILDHKLQ